MIKSITFLSLLAIASVCAPALADDVNGAATAFSQAQEAMLAGDPARAADLYELADQLAPSAAALRNAARARVAANHEAMAATLAAELLRRYPSDPESREVAEAILSKLSPRLAQLEVTCSEACTLALDARAINGKASTHHAFFAQPGARTIAATFDGGRQTQKQLTALAGQTTSVSLEAPPEVEPTAAEPGAGLVAHAPPPVAEHRHGIGRKWVLVTGLVTLGFGAGLAVEGLSTLSERDDIRAAVATGDAAGAMAKYNAARSTQLRTNILIGATAAAGIASVVLAILTNWSPGRTEIGVAPAAGGAAVSFGGQF